MYMFNSTMEDTRCFMNATQNLFNHTWSSVKNYWFENVDTLCAGLDSMNGHFHIPASVK